MRYSKQRETIYEVLCATKCHPDAEWIYNEVRKQIPDISLGTVYRNLHQMAQDGRLMELDGPVARFDATVEPHTHLRCIRCGCVADGELPYDESIDREVIAEGWQIANHSLMFAGICPACVGE